VALSRGHGKYSFRGNISVEEGNYRFKETLSSTLPLIHYNKCMSCQVLSAYVSVQAYAVVSCVYTLTSHFIKYMCSTARNTNILSRAFWKGGAVCRCFPNESEQLDLFMKGPFQRVHAMVTSRKKCNNLWS